MSRKKKKQYKQMQDKLQQQSLNGWNCPAVEVENIDSSAAGDTHTEEPVEISYSDLLQEVYSAHEAERESRMAASEESEEPMEEDPLWAVMPEATGEDLSDASPRAVPDPMADPMADPVAESVAPAVARGSQVEAVRARVSAAASRARESLLRHFTKVRKTPEELEEDNLKFGGLEEDTSPEDAPSEPEAPPVTALRTPIPMEKLLPALQYARDTYDWGYTECYYIGVQVLRNCHDLYLWCFKVGVWMRYNIPHFIRVQRHRMARVFDRITDSCLHPFRDITAKTRSASHELKKIKRREEPGHRLRDDAMVVFRYLCSLGKPINSIASFVLPIVGCAVLAAVILYFQQINYALEVEYSGVKLGYIASEGEFYEAKNKVYDRLINEDYVPLDDSRPSFRLVITDKANLMNTETLTNRIMTTSKNEVAMADGVYIDGAFLGAVEDGSEFLFYIDSILDSYRTGTAHERVQFVKRVGLQHGIYPVSSVRPVHEIMNALENNESLPQTHRVAKDETLEAIAEKNSTTVEDIIKLNDGLQARAEEVQDTPALVEGESILVNRVELSLGIQVTRRETHLEDIDYGVDYRDDNKQLDSYVRTISNGVKGEREIVADVTYVDGQKVNETVIERNVVKEPVNAKKVRGTLKPADFLPANQNNTSASFIWPVAGGYMSAGLYGYYGHTGMDIAAPQGTGIYAARSGTVTYASNRNVWPYGKRVNISHGNGFTSLYAHCSQVMVQSGQYVEQGQLIAKIGRTGNASGNHCHFEIRMNGQVLDPAKFIGTWYRGR